MGKFTRHDAAALNCPGSCPWQVLEFWGGDWQVECIQHGLRTLAFCKSRKLCELVTAYTRESLKLSAPHLQHSISVYRAGYSPQVGGPAPPKIRE